MASTVADATVSADSRAAQPTAGSTERPSRVAGHGNVRAKIALKSDPIRQFAGTQNDGASRAA
jgi:hypothetical protein